MAGQIHEARMEADAPPRGWASTAHFWLSTKTSPGAPPNHSKARTSPS